MQRKLFTVIGLVLLLIVAACAPQQQPAPAGTQAPSGQQQPPPGQPAQPIKGGTFTDASFADAATMQPLLSQDTASSAYINRVYAGLTRLDPQTLDVVGDMYEGKGELSADGSTLTWHLRKGLMWSDGTPITTQDIIFTWQKMMDPNVKFPYRKLYQDAFSDVSAPDDYTVVYKLTKPGFCPALNSSGLVAPIPKHVFEKLDVNQNDLNNKPGVTDGLWSLKDWQKDDHATFNPAYKGYVRGEASLDTYQFRIVKDNTVNTQLFKTQEVDLAQPDPVDWDEIKALPFANTYTYYPTSGASWTYIGFNLRNPILGDKVVRQAISTAINKQEMIDKIRLGHAKQQYSVFSASSWAYTADVPKFDFDSAKAKQMLKDAGYTPGADGILQKDGKVLKFRLHYNAGNKQREQIATISQQYLKDVGIAVDVIPEEWTAYLKRIGESRDFDMFVLGWSTGVEPNGSANIWKSDGGQNDPGYKNPEIDKLFDQAATVAGCKQDDRKKVYEQIQKIIAEDQPYVFLYTSEALVAVNKRVQVNPVTALGISYDLQKWQLAQKTQ